MSNLYVNNIKPVVTGTGVSVSGSLYVSGSEGVVITGSIRQLGSQAGEYVTFQDFVGIGNIAPTKALHVTGDALITGDLTVSGTFDANVEDFKVSANTVVLGDESSDSVTISANTVTYPVSVIHDCAGDFTIDADGDHIQFKFGGAAGTMWFTNENSGDGVIQQKVDAKDLVIKQFDDTEVARFTDAGSVEVKDNLSLKSDSAVLKFGASEEITLTHVADVGLTLAAAAANTPVLEIVNNHNGGTAGKIKFNNHEGASVTAGADGDDLGSIEFWGYDDQGTPAVQQYAGILAEISDASSNNEGGKLSLQVAEHDGTVTTGLLLQDGSEDGEIDVTIGAGSNSVVTIPGDIDMEGDLDVNGTANLDNTDIDGTFTMDGTAFDVNATSTCAIDNTNTSNGVTINTATSGGPISIGHSTSETTVNDNLTVTGTTTHSDNVKIIDDKTLTFGTDDDWTIEYDENGDDDLVMTGGALSIESGVSAKPVVTIMNTNGDAEGVKLQLKKLGGSAANSETLGTLAWHGQNDAGTPQEVIYANILGKIGDVTDGGEDGQLDFQVMKGGSATSLVSLVGTIGETQINHDLGLKTDGAKFKFGADGEIILQHVHDVGLTLSAQATNTPVLEIQNQHAGGTGGKLKFNNLEGTSATDGADDDDLGSIEFWGYDDGTPTAQQYAGILAEISDASSGVEGGKLSLQVAEHDGSVTTGLLLQDGNNNGEIDVTIGAGRSSLTTIAGTAIISDVLTVTGSGGVHATLNLEGGEGASGIIIFKGDNSDDAGDDWRVFGNSTGFYIGNDIASAGTYVTHLEMTQNATVTDSTVAAKGHLTVGHDLTVTGDSTFNGVSATFASSTSASPIIHITNTNADATSGEIRFSKDSASGADSDVMGKISFYGTDASNNDHEELAYIQALVGESDHGTESSSMEFYVAENDGTRTRALRLKGNKSVDGEISVNIGAGTNSVLDVAGAIAVGGRLITAAPDGDFSINPDSVHDGSTPNVAGKNIIISGGKSVGNEMGGEIQFKTASPGGSGTSENNTSTAAVITGDGFLGLGTGSPEGTLTIGKGHTITHESVTVTEVHSGDDSIVAETKIKIPASSYVIRIYAVVTQASNLGTHNVNIKTSTAAGQSADATIGTNVVERIGASSTNDTKSTASTGSSADINVKTAKDIYINDTGFFTGASDLYVYVCNAGTGNGTSNASSGKLSIYVEYIGMD